MDNNPLQRLSNPELQCAEPSVKMCVSDRCVCHVPTGGQWPSQLAQNPATRCQVVVAFQEQRPDVPELYFSGSSCAVSADIALAVALAYFLKGSANTQIR